MVAGAGQPERGLLGGLFTRGQGATQAGERAFLQAMLDVEVALLSVLAKAGMAPAESARELARIQASELDLEELGRRSGENGTPVPGLVSMLRERLSEETAAHVHRGATSQDIVDTAVMLVARRTLEPLLADLAAAADVCAGLTEQHRRTLAPGRTLLQQALPVTFALKAAGWLAALDGARGELEEIVARLLSVQLGGAVGTLASLGERGLELVRALACELDLAEPELPWHTLRLRPAHLACALGMALGAMGKVARDVVLLAQTEVAEAGEGGGEDHGRSSTMPHKRNPVGAIAVVACAQRGPGLVATMLAAMVQEHERAAGAWQAEWETMLELLRLTASAADATREVMSTLQVHPDRMAANLELTGGLLMSESVAGALAKSLGRPRARDVVEQAALRAATEERSLREVLMEVPEVLTALGPEGLERALAPERYLGASDPLVEQALDHHRRRGQAGA